MRVDEWVIITKYCRSVKDLRHPPHQPRQIPYLWPNENEFEVECYSVKIYITRKKGIISERYHTFILC